MVKEINDKRSFPLFFACEFQYVQSEANIWSNPREDNIEPNMLFFLLVFIDLKTGNGFNEHHSRWIALCFINAYVGLNRF